jgi:hypothetical protein
MENFLKNSLDLKSELVYNCKLLMMMGDYAPIFEKAGSFVSKIGCKRSRRIRIVAAVCCCKIYGGVIVNLWS